MKGKDTLLSKVSVFQSDSKVIYLFRYVEKNEINEPRRLKSKNPIIETSCYIS